MNRQNWFVILKNRITPFMTRKNQRIIYCFASCVFYRYLMPERFTVRNVNGENRYPIGMKIKKKIMV